MLTEEQLEFRALAREFAQGELRPHVEAWDAACELPNEVFGKLAELGFWGMRIPEAHGGLEMDAAAFLTVLEGLAWGEAAVALSVAIHNGPVTRALLAAGTPEQHQRWLPAMASGEAVASFALSEPDAGSDPTALATTARRTDGGWVLDGRKRWVTGGDRAGLLLVFARTDAAAAGGEGISAFLVPRDAGGIGVTARERTLGLRASETVSLSLDGTEVAADALLGAEGEGYRIALDAITTGRLGVAAQALGIAQAAYEHALRYALEREQFGVPLHELGAIQEKLAGMAIRIAQARALTLGMARRLDGEGAGDEASSTVLLPRSLRAGAAMAKVAASEAAMWVTDEAVQIFGGYGYMRDYPVEKLMRDAKGTEIYEGSNEVLRMVVALDAVREVARSG